MGWKEDVVAQAQAKRQREEEASKRKADALHTRLLAEHQRKFRCYICDTPSTGPGQSWHSGSEDTDGYYSSDWDLPTGLNVCTGCEQRKVHYRSGNSYEQHIRHLVCGKCSVVAENYTICKNCAPQTTSIMSSYRDGYNRKEGMAIPRIDEVMRILMILFSCAVLLAAAAISSYNAPC
jgi:hypothetical protein